MGRLKRVTLNQALPKENSPIRYISFETQPKSSPSEKAPPFE